MVRFVSATSALVLLAVTSTTTTSAFTPSIGRSTFVARPTVSSASSSTTALQMNLFDRFSRVVNSNLNSILKNLEDPEKIMNQALEDMQADLVKVRQSYAEVTATQRRLLKQKEQCEAVAQDWYKRAQLALQASNDGLAKEALTRRQQQLDEAASIQAQIDAQAASIDKLYDGMQLLEKKILESKAKKEQMVARARTAQSTQKVNDMLTGLTGKTSMDAFKRMEEKVEALEAAAEVSAEMGNLNALPGSSSSDLEREFKLLEGSAAVDDELKKLKGLLGSSSSSSSGATASASPKVDDEFEKLKREAGL